MPKSRRTPNGAILWDGPSLLNGDRIMVVITGLIRSTVNRKTGDMYQTWVAPTDVVPSIAIATGQDASVCGDCPLRKDICYVNSMGINSMWTAHQTNPLPRLDERAFLEIKRSGIPLRITAYGDPAATPFEAWEPLLKAVPFATGYTHQWRNCDHRWRRHLMASVETERAALEAQQMGWRTFRIISSGDAYLPGEILCPNTQNKTINCRECKLCDGAGDSAGAYASKKPNIVNPVHGVRWKKSSWEAMQGLPPGISPIAHSNSDEVSLSPLIPQKSQVGASSLA